MKSMLERVGDRPRVVALNQHVAIRSKEGIEGGGVGGRVGNSQDPRVRTNHLACQRAKLRFENYRSSIKAQILHCCLV